MNFNPLITVMIGISLFMWVFTYFLRPELPTIPAGSDQVAVIGEEQGLDLRALPAVVGESKNAADLEARINSPQGINNLDLDKDGKVDFIRVTEFGDRASGKYGFSLTVETAQGKIEEIATIEVTPKDDQVEVSAYGNENLYGSSRGYSGVFPMTSFFLLGYLLNSSSLYTSPYGYSRYPSYYSPFSASSTGDYAQRTSRFRNNFSTAAARGPSMDSPFSGQGVRRGLRNSRGFQKGFGNYSGRRVGNGGFGQRSSSGIFGQRNARKSFGMGIFGKLEKTFSAG